MKHAALLRGVNVGTAVRVPMKELKATLEGLGLDDVVTYLNSGNAVFSSPRDSDELAGLVSDGIAEAFGVRIPTIVRSAAQMIEVAESIPAEWTNDATQQTYVAYLFPEFDRPELVSELPIKRELVNIYYTPGALVWNIKRENLGRSRITAIAGHASYAGMTTRNVNTARKLAALCAEE